MIRRFSFVVFGLVAALALVPAQLVLAGPGPGIGPPVSAGEVNGVCAILPATVDATRPADVLAGTRAWNLSITTNAPLAPGVTGSITVNSGYPASRLIYETQKGPFPCSPGTPLSALPFTTSGACGIGGCVNLNLGSDVAAQATAGYYLTRTATPSRIGPHGGQQTAVVTLNQGLNCAAVSVVSNVPGATVTAASLSGDPSGHVSFGGPRANVDFGCNYSGQPVTLTVTYNIPNPFGRSFVSKPEVQLFNGASAFPNVSCSGFATGGSSDPGPTSSETLSDSTLDGGVAGAGSATFTLNGYSGSWSRSQGCATFVDYQPAPLPSASHSDEDESEDD